MKIDVRKFVIYVLTLTILFQDTIIKITGISLLNYMDELFVLALFMIALCRSRGQIPDFAGRLMAGALLFMLVGIGSCVLFSQYSLGTLMAASLLAVKFFLLLSAVIIYRPDEKLIKLFVSAIKFAGIILLATGIINFCFPAIWVRLLPFTWIDWRMGLPSVMGLFIHPGQYGWFMLFAALLYYGEFKVYRRQKSLLISVLFIFAAILSLKAKVIVGVGAILWADTFLLDGKKISRKKLGFFLMALSGGILLFGGYLLEAFSKYIIGTTSEVSARYVLLNRSLQILADYFPLGVGFGKFGSWYARINYSEYYYKYNCTTTYGLFPEDPRFATDTFWPAILGETGFIGTFIYLLILYCIIKKLMASIHHIGKSHFQRLMAVCGFYIIVQALVESTGEPIFNSAPQNILIGLFVGFGLSVNLRLKASR